ncbi:unnamed protein product [Rotaria sp. Silwood2]|nr:unnamed protein product [Rotaria sp. Silwood2]CAF2748328.1 unnamed protein product [Rotaria sp. Silwood2]CAF3175976.1 unnamed protein product [Rotaria sp. Silwood2]CAF4184626.1 unnamed protein product [Rotaria sp. Silwood2]CAF4335533.1 unnamed protein product [Rotaria sp. Silwood2]
MTSEFYFFDQYSHGSHIGGVYRTKRDSKDLNQALYHAKIASSIEDENSDRTEINTPTSIKKQTNQITNDTLLQTILRKSKTPIVPEILIDELNRNIQIFDNKSKTTSLPSIPSKSRQSSLIDSEQHINHEDELINLTKNLPKVSLPSLLIVQLNSTWSDLIQNTEYEYKVWRTKAGKEAWHQYVQQKHSKLINRRKQQSITDNKSIIRRQTSSRVSPLSLTNLSHRQSLKITSKIRCNRPLSRASITGSNTSQDNQRLVKVNYQGGASENVIETIKNGIHVEFKLSTQMNETKQKTIQLDEQNIALFDVPKPPNAFDEDIIALTQNKCKRLLAETKQKILATTNNQNTKHQKLCRIWFYEDNQTTRNKNNFLTLNEFNRRPKSKFALAILRHEIPEKYNIDIDISETKHKCYIELEDGSSQIYYPSGRLAVLCLRSSYSTTLFFNDTNSIGNQFLGLVTSTGNVLLMQPKLHAHFITNNQRECSYLCNGKTGIIKKQIQWHLKDNNYQGQSISNDKDNINQTLFDNTVQLQLNSFMQLEYNNSSNIHFVFTCQNEKFHFQLGIHLPTQSSIPMDLITTVPMKKFSQDKKNQTITKKSNPISSNDISNVLEKQQISDEQLYFNQLPMIQELILLRKRIENICHSWLKQYRTILGIMDINAYCFPDLPVESQTKQQMNNSNRSNSAKQHKHVPILTKRSLTNNDFVQLIDREQQFLQIDSEEKTELNVIENAIEQFVPHSNVGRAIKQRIFTNDKIIPTTLPVIK